MDKIFIAYVAITTAGIIIVYLYGLFHGLFHRVHRITLEKVIMDCPVCTYRYIIEKMQKIHKCPQCNSLNKT